MITRHGVHLCGEEVTYKFAEADAYLFVEFIENSHPLSAFLIGTNGKLRIVAIDTITFKHIEFGKHKYD